jgi:hypothetical protein
MDIVVLRVNGLLVFVVNMNFFGKKSHVEVRFEHLLYGRVHSKCCFGALSYGKENQIIGPSVK